MVPEAALAATEKRRLAQISKPSPAEWMAGLLESVRLNGQMAGMRPRCARTVRLHCFRVPFGAGVPYLAPEDDPVKQSEPT
jgi:hypothetical protein